MSVGGEIRAQDKFDTVREVISAGRDARYCGCAERVDRGRIFVSESWLRTRRRMARQRNWQPACMIAGGVV